MRNQQLIRQWKILQCLSSASQGLTYKQLLSALEPDDTATLRTLQRDLQALEFAGFHLVEDRAGREVVWSLSFRHSLPLPLEVGELIALYGLVLSGQIQGLPMGERLGAAWRKLLTQLPAKTRKFLIAVQDSLVVRAPLRPQPALGEDDLAGKVSRAVAGSQTLEIVYDSLNTGRRTRRRVDPYGIVSTVSDIYVWGFCHASQDFRTFHLGRIRSMSETGRTFTRAETSVESAFRNSFQVWLGDPARVVVRFTGKAAVLVSEKQWHPSQKLTSIDGGVELQLDVHPGKDLLSWILGFGAEAEVLAPADLRQQVIDHFSRGLRQYGAVSGIAKRPPETVAEAGTRARVPARKI